MTTLRAASLSSSRSRSNVLSSVSSKAVATDSSLAPMVARLALGSVLLPHGAQHALGWFGGYGFAGTLGWMTDTLGIPAPVAAFGIAAELVAPIALLLGVGGRLAAVIMAGFMAVAASTHAPNGFFMNWFGALPAGTEGYEYHLLAIALAAVVALEGSGRFSIDRHLTRR